MHGRSSRFLIGGGVLLVVFLGSLLILPLFLSPTYLNDLAFAHIQRTFGPHIRVGKTSLSLLPYPHIEVSEVVVKERPDAHAFFRAKFISLELELLPLIRQEILVKELLIEHPEIEIKRDRTGEWELFQGNQQNAEGSVLATLLFMDKIVISEGRITFIDETPLEEARGVVLEGVNISIVSSESPSHRANVEASGKIRRGQGVSTFFWDGLINFSTTKEQLSEEKASEEASEEAQSVQINGQLKVVDLDIRQFAELLYPESLLTVNLGLAQVESQVGFMLGQVGYEMILSELTLDSTHGSFSGNANVTGLFANDLTIFVSMASTPLSLQTVRAVVPKIILPLRVAALWDEANLDGTIQVMQATIAGSTRSDVGISVVGTFQFDQSILTYPTIPEIKVMHGTMVVEPDRVRFADFSGMYDDIPVEAANGLILFNEAGPWLDLEVRAKVLVHEVVKVMTSFSGDKSSSPYLSNLNILEGIGDLRLHFSGLLEGGEGVVVADGDYDARGVMLHVPDVKGPIVITKGRILFSQYDLRFENIIGNIGDSQFRVHGVVESGERAKIDRINIQATLQHAFFNQILSKSSSISLAPLANGAVTLQADISGFLDSPKISGELDLLDSAIHVPGVVQKQPGVPGVLSFSVRLKTNGDMALDQVELAIRPIKLSVRGLMRFQPTFEFLTRINSGPIYLGLLPEGVTIGDQILRSGILEISMDVSGRGLELKNWRPRGWIALTEGVAMVNDLEFPIRNLFLRLKMTPSLAEIKRFEFKILKSDVQLNGTIKNWRGKSEVDVSLDSSNFDLGLLVPQAGGSSIRSILEDLAGNSTLVGSFRIQQSEYKKIRAENLRGIVKIREGLVTLDRIRGEAYGESIAGRVFIHLPPNKSPAIRSSFHIRGIPFERFHQSLGFHNRYVTGQFSVRGMIQGHGRNPQGVVSTLNGNMDVVIEDGYVQKGTVLPRILSILNLPSVLRHKVDLNREGFPFHTVTATFNIQDGVMTSKNLIVDSPIMKMTAAGHYDFAHDSLDIVSAVSPFGPYSDFLQGIPLFGRILAGDRKGVATALFQVRGSLSQPDVRYMPLESLKTQVAGFSQLAYDILQNAIRLPGDFLIPNRNLDEQDPRPQANMNAVSVQ